MYNKSTSIPRLYLTMTIATSKNVTSLSSIQANNHTETAIENLPFVDLGIIMWWLDSTITHLYLQYTCNALWLKCPLIEYSIEVFGIIYYYWAGPASGWWAGSLVKTSFLEWPAASLPTHYVRIISCKLQLNSLSKILI